MKKLSVLCPLLDDVSCVRPSSEVQVGATLTYTCLLRYGAAVHTDGILRPQIAWQSPNGLTLGQMEYNETIENKEVEYVYALCLMFVLLV